MYIRDEAEGETRRQREDRAPKRGSNSFSRQFGGGADPKSLPLRVTTHCPRSRQGRDTSDSPPRGLAPGLAPGLAYQRPPGGLALLLLPPTGSLRGGAWGAGCTAADTEEGGSKAIPAGPQAEAALPVRGLTLPGRHYIPFPGGSPKEGPPAETTGQGHGSALLPAYNSLSF